MNLDISLQQRFGSAAEARDFCAIISLAQANGLEDDLSTQTNIGRRTLRGMHGMQIKPSKNQIHKIVAYARQCAA